MKLRSTVFALAAASLVLAACGEKAQTASPSAKKSDGKAYDAAPTNVAGNWKSGDAKAWEEHMRVRAQSQNEYSRAPAAK